MGSEFSPLAADKGDDADIRQHSSENGVVCPEEEEMSPEEAYNDDFRINYLESYADQIALKISEGVPVKSHILWALTDNFEWQEGNVAKFGVVTIDYKNDCKRHPKKSAGHMKEYFARRIATA